MQRVQLPSSKFMKTTLELARLQNDSRKELLDVHMINEDVIAVDFQTKNSFIGKPKFQADIIGAMVCSYGRCLLYELMECLGPSRLFYVDTDSAIYLERPGDLEIDTGDFLGCLTDEVPKGIHIEKFCSSAPKTYALGFSDGTQNVKMKGIRLHYANKQIFNFETIRKVATGQLRSVSSTYDEEFRRVKYHGLVYKRSFAKTYKMTFCKRLLVAKKNYSIPYGFRGQLW